ncbi:MAG TPA: AAA family ATPase, partial [Candidatus Limnocylindrales bacterium]|nr:AAA family ATPase [Candidatus Limnocylindrales bacterium]
RALGPVPVKGVAEPVDVFELIAAARGRTRLQAAAARGLTRFVGRDDEMARLRQALEEARAGQGRVVAAVGEAGVGKSRLFHEFVHSHRTGGCLVLESSSVAYGKATAYLSIVDLLRGYFRIEAGDDPRTVREKATGKVLALDESLRPVLPVFLALLEVPALDDDAWDRLDPGQRRQRTVDAFKRLLLRESQVRPVVVMFEDLHWVDADSQAVLDGLLDSLPAARVLLLVNYRPEYRHNWGSKTFYGQIRLDPLGPEGAEDLLAALLGSDPGLDPLRQLLVARTEGNPFFLEECVRTLAETGVFDGAPGAYRVTRSVEGIHVPATVQAVVAARIDRLSSQDKTLLETAAVIGKDVPFRLLQAVAGVPDDALRAALGRLLAAEFLYEAALFPELEYTFKHALTHEIAYGSLLHERRRDLHARIVRAFEAAAPDRVAERAHWLAQHAFRGELWGKAAAYFRNTPAAPDALEAVGGPESAGQLWWLGEHDRAITVGQRDLAIGGGFRNLWMQVVGRLRLGQIYHSLGDHAQAIQHLERNVAVLDGELVAERPPEMAGLPSVLTLTWLALCLAEQGRFAEGVGRGLEALRIAESVGQSYSVINACVGLGTMHLLQGDLARAIEILERGVALVRVDNVAALVPTTASPLAAAYALKGRAAEALALQEEAVEQAAAMKLLANQPQRLARLAEAHLLAGRLERAAEAGQRAVQLARDLRERGHEAHALRVVADVAARPESPNAGSALASYAAALALATELGMAPLGTQCHRGLAAFLERTGDAPGARAHRLAADELAGALRLHADAASG